MLEELPILSISILIPIFTALYISVSIKDDASPSKRLYVMYVALLSTILTFLSVLYIIVFFDYNKTSYQFIEKYNWISSINFEFFIAVDGLSIYFIGLTALLSVISIIISIFTIKVRTKEYLICFLLLESFCIGAFSAVNLMLFYIFFELILVPMYFIIGIWGGENRLYASLKFFIYTFFGSVFFLISIIYIYIKTSTFTIPVIIETFPKLDSFIEKALFLAIFLGFAIKMPIPPFHTWLPDAHVQAPTAGSIMLAGILLKFAGYGILRVLMPIVPFAFSYFSNYIIIIGVVSIVYASLIALNQTDMKKMIAYSSVAHMGYVTIGIFSLNKIGISGAIFQMISHGIISAALFLIVGILYERHHTKDMYQYGGVAKKMPVLAVFFMISVLASIGLPGTSGFIGEFFSITGLFANYVTPAIVSATGVILGAVYMLKLYKFVMLGKINNHDISNFKDLHKYEVISLMPLVVLIIYLGLYPSEVLNTFELQITNLLSRYGY